jgi:hypothetical protein
MDIRRKEVIIKQGGGCKVIAEPIKWMHSGERTRVATLPERISIDNLKQTIGDIVVGYLPKPQDMPFTQWDDRFINCLQNGTVIWLENTDIGRWFAHINPKIPKNIQYVVASGDSDADAPQNPAWIDDPRVLHWFGMNCDLKVCMF